MIACTWSLDGLGLTSGACGRLMVLGTDPSEDDGTKTGMARPDKVSGAKSVPAGEDDQDLSNSGMQVGISVSVNVGTKGGPCGKTYFT